MSGASPSHRSGRFITFEGGEGTGKSTQARRLAARLREEAGLDVVETREPGGTPGAEIVRQTVLSGRVADFGPFAEALLMNAARDDHLNVVIRPALEAGQWVVCDRFADSTRAYQGVLGGLDPALVTSLEDAVVGDTRPDLTIILDLAADIGIERAQAATRAAGHNTDAERFEDADLADHEKLRAAFLEIAAEEPERCVVIDASGSMDEVANEVWKAVDDRLLAVGTQEEKGGAG